MGDLIGARDLPSDSFLQLPSSKFLILVANLIFFFIHRSSFKSETQNCKTAAPSIAFLRDDCVTGIDTLAQYSVGVNTEAFTSRVLVFHTLYLSL